MSNIRNIAFDLGGVVLALSYEQAVARFGEIGLRDARRHLDAFEQKGIFGDLEAGRITAETFRKELSLLVGRELSHEECYYAWHGYVDHVPPRNLEALQSLRARGYKVCLLSNTNHYMMEWANRDFDGQGHPISYFFDAMYLSYQCEVMKPHREIFEIMLRGQQALPEETIFVDDGQRNVEAAAALGMHTLHPQDNEDWIQPLEQILTHGVRNDV
ncbi:MAG: HAD family phosphatase [Prevotella sp.]|nr:HAD family phosphatase [Prevotella sp.]